MYAPCNTQLGSAPTSCCCSTTTTAVVTGCCCCPSGCALCCSSLHPPQQHGRSCIEAVACCWRLPCTRLLGWPGPSLGCLRQPWGPGCCWATAARRALHLSSRLPCCQLAAPQCQEPLQATTQETAHMCGNLHPQLLRLGVVSHKHYCAVSVLAGRRLSCLLLASQEGIEDDAPEGHAPPG